MSGKIQEVINKFDVERRLMLYKQKPETNEHYIKLIRIEERICRFNKLLYLIKEIEQRPVDYLYNSDYNNDFFGNRPVLDLLIDKFIRDYVVGAYA